MAIPANSHLQIGLIGAGLVGQLHAEAIAQVPGIKLVALADLRPELCRQVAASAGIARTYATHLDLLADSSVDAVAVVVHRSATSAVVRDCLLAGKHVLSEKPMAMTAPVAAELAERARGGGLLYTIGFQKRHDPGMERCHAALSELEDTGRLGRLMLIRAWNHSGRDREDGLIMTREPRPAAPQTDAKAPPWLPPEHAPAYDRFVNTYCHDINALHAFHAGAPEVRAAELDVLGGQSVILGYPGLIVNMALTLSEMENWQRRGTWDEGFEFHFEAGRLRIAFPPPLYRHRAARVVLTCGSEPAEILCDGYSAVSVFTLQASHFLADLRSGKPSRCAAQACVPDMALIERIWRAGTGNKARAVTGDETLSMSEV